MTGISGLPSAKLAAHEAAVTRLRDAYAAVPAGVPVRLAKPTSNLFRYTRDAAKPGQPGSERAVLDVAAFSRVIHVDPVARTAVVGGMTTYEDLCEATLPHQLMPLVVPQLKTITLGGAVTGLGIESSSLWHGLPHESVIEMQILTGDGRVVVATKDNEHSDLFYGFPNSYGTLGYSLALTIELMPVKPYVHLRHFAFNDPASCMAAIAEIAADGSYHGHQADFLDGVAFSGRELYLTVGAFSDKAPWLSDYTGQQVYYKSLRSTREDFLTVKNYIWRWDTDWFWCSRAFGVQNTKLRPFWPRRYRRSDVYRKLVALDQRYGLTAVLYEKRQQPPREMVVQDVEIPVGRGSGVPRLLRAEREHDAGLAVPGPAARRPHVDALPDGPGRGLRELRLLGHGAAPAGPARRLLQPDAGGGGRRARRAQVALLLRLLLRGRVPEPVQRSGVRQAQGRVRRRRPPAYPFRQVRARPLRRQIYKRGTVHGTGSGVRGDRWPGRSGGVRGLRRVDRRALAAPR